MTLDIVSNTNMFAKLTDPQLYDKHLFVPTESQGFYRAFGAKVATARKARKITQAKLASVLGLSRTSVTNIEKGRQQVQVHTLARLADILSVHVSDLLPGRQLLETQTVTDNLRSYSPERGNGQLE
jgi:DNA-binding XRE family transcriptional regulator